MAIMKQQEQRIAMVLEFDGRPFHGWQQQDNASSVQACLQAALVRIEGGPVSATAAGRTDAGVHAEALLAHADVSAERWTRSHKAYLPGCNSLLPDEIRVIGVRAVEENFHARFDCRERVYRYQIWNRNTASSLHRWRHWWMPRALNLDAMREAACHCVGRRDFSALRAAGCQASDAVRTIRTLSVEQQGYCINISVSADAFLYHMVRNLVGNLVEVGAGKRSPEAFLDLLSSGNRSLGAATAPAHGLYFTDAVYDTFSSRGLIAAF
ncbi:MAG: tRNA pseudouridine(38-40) synthase TruA [Mariprofundus sp.]|nr:tRNA pseudouridine(38-40) synthase TruA [Mariprofundus sp.]